MPEPDVFILADHALNGVVAQITDEQWDMVMPPNFATSRTDHALTLREIVSYHAYDDAWVPDMLAGRTMEEVGKEAFSGDLLGDDPKAAFAAIVERACAAARSLDDLDRTVHCTFGDFPAREYLWQINSFRGLRAHDIARSSASSPPSRTSSCRGSGRRSLPTPRSGAPSASSARRPGRRRRPAPGPPARVDRPRSRGRMTV